MCIHEQLNEIIEQKIILLFSGFSVCCEQNKSLAEFIKPLMKSSATSLYSRDIQDLNELLQNECCKMNILLHFCSIFHVGRLNFLNYCIYKVVLMLIYVYFTLRFGRELRSLIFLT